MPLKKYEIKSKITGESLIVEREKPPTTEEADSLFASNATKIPPPVDPSSLPPEQPQEKKLGYWGRVAQPLKELPGKFVESAEAAKNAPVTPGAEIPAAIGRGGGMIAEGLINTLGAGLGSINQLAGGVPGKIVTAPIVYGAKAGEALKIPGQWGSALAKTDIGKSLYKFGTDPEQAQNLRSLGAVGSFLGFGLGKKAVAEAAEKGMPIVKGRVPGMPDRSPQGVIKATEKYPATRKLFEKIPEAAQEGATVTEGLKGVSKELVKYGLDKYAKPLNFKPMKIEDEAQALYQNAYKRADESLLAAARKNPDIINKAEKVDIMDAFDQAILEEAERGTKGFMSPEFKNNWKRVGELRDVYAKEWSGMQPVEKALEFKREVLKNKQKLFEKAGPGTPDDPIDIAIKENVMLKLNEKLAGISPEFDKFNQMAKELKTIQKAAHELRPESNRLMNIASLPAQLKTAGITTAQRLATGEIPGTGALAAGLGNIGQQGFTQYSLANLLKGRGFTPMAPKKYGVPYAAPLREKITTPISYPKTGLENINDLKKVLKKINKSE